METATPSCDRESAAGRLDAALRRFARQEAELRVALGRLAAALLESRAYHDLGFARLADYARERLGLSAREFQSLASVYRRLAELPRCRRAFERGQINWTQLRSIVLVASPADEHAWCALATSRPASELGRLARAQARAGRKPTPGSPPSSAPEAAPEADEPVAIMSLACPQWMQLLWRDTARLASKVAGAELSPAQAAEVVAAEAASASASTRDAAPPHVPGLVVMRAEAADTAPTDDDDARNHLATLTRADEDPFEEDLLPTSMQLPGEDDAPPPSPRDLDAALIRTLSASQSLDGRLGALLHTFLEMRLFKDVGYASAAEYVNDRLGMSPRKARDLRRIERRAVRSGRDLLDAYRRGSPSWLRTLIVMPVVTATNAPQWIARAQTVTVRRLADEVDWALRRRARAATGDPLLPPAPDALSAAGEDITTREQLAQPLPDGFIHLERQIGAHSGDQAGHQVGLADTAAGSSQCWAKPDCRVRLTGPATLIDFVADTIIGLTRHGEQAWAGFYRMIRAAREEWRRLPRHRNPIFERDGWRCRVPACSARRNLQEHHIVFRARGGGNTRSNRITLCAWHHMRGIHTGRVRARGDADRTVRWELGSGSKTEPFLKLANDYYS